MDEQRRAPTVAAAAATMTEERREPDGAQIGEHQRQIEQQRDAEEVPAVLRLTNDAVRSPR